MNEKLIKLLASGAMALAALAPGVALADPAKDIQVTARALTFLENGPTGPTVIGVVYDPSKSASVSEKDAIISALGSGYNAGALILTGKPMQADAISGVKYIFITRGVSYAAVGADARAKHIVSVGSAPACVESGACVMGIATDPTVLITVNHNSATAVGAVFKAAFRMMIHEL